MTLHAVLFTINAASRHMKRLQCLSP